MKKGNDIRYTSQEKSQVTMDTLRKAFARCCKILGLDQKTCLALTLLLYSKESMMTMLWYLDWAEQEGIKPSTTMVVKAAQLIREEYDRKIRPNIDKPKNSTSNEQRVRK